MSTFRSDYLYNRDLQRICFVSEDDDWLNKVRDSARNAIGTEFIDLRSYPSGIEGTKEVMFMIASILQFTTNYILTKPRAILVACLVRYGCTIITDKKPDDRERVALVIPAGSGKSTLSREFGWFDIDLIHLQNIEDRVAELRQERKWAEHNVILWDFQKSWFSIYGRPDVILLHSADQAKYLGYNIIYTLKISKKLHSIAIEHRTEEHKLLSLQNWRETKGIICESWEEFDLLAIQLVNKHVKGYYYDYIISDPKVVRSHLTREWPLALNGGQFTLTQTHLLKNMGLDFLFGNVIRRSIYNRMPLGRTFIGLGDRVKNIINSTEHGVTDLAINIEPVENFQFPCCPIVFQPREKKFPSLGQTKLYFSDVNAIHRFNPKNVFVIGSAPGEHWSDILKQFPWIDFHMYDPRPMNLSIYAPNCYVHREEMTEEKLLHMNIQEKSILLVDVRNDNRSDNTTWQKAVMEDTLTFLRWVDLFFDMGGVGAAIKFRFGYDLTDYISIDWKFIIMPEAYSSNESTESRMLLFPVPMKTKLYYSDYMIWAKKIATYRRTNGSDSIEKFLMSTNYYVQNFTQFNLEQPTELIGDYLPNLENMQIKATFSYSDSRNGKWDFVKPWEDIVITLPKIQVAVARGKFHDKFVKTSGYTDHGYDMATVSHLMRSVYPVKDRHRVKVWNANDFIIQQRFDIHGHAHNLRHEIFPYNGSGLDAQLWMVVEIRDRPSYQWQLWWSNPTHLVKLITPRLREVFHLDDTSLHEVRRWALYVCFTTPGQKSPVQLVKDEKITGAVNGKPVSVAGHWLNILLAATYGLCDHNHYFDLVYTNLKSWQDKYWKELMNSPVIVEKSEKGMWHSYNDYYVATACYYVYSKQYGTKWNPIIAYDALRALSRWRKEFKWFSFPAKHIQDRWDKMFKGKDLMREINKRKKSLIYGTTLAV